MSLERAPLERDPDASQNNWPAPLAMFIAWLVRIFAQIAKLKRIRRTTKFKPNWRDHWPNLRQLEWIRDQILAACAARLLAGETLDAESNFTPSTDPPAGYGGPCPRTPFEMNRRFLAIARFNADPEAAVEAHVRRIAKRAGIDLSNSLVAHGSTDAALRTAAHHELATADTSQALMLSSAPCARPSKDERALPSARGPPTCLTMTKTPHHPNAARDWDRTRLPAARNRPIHPPHDDQQGHHSTYEASHPARAGASLLNDTGRRRMTPATLVPTDLSADTTQDERRLQMTALPMETESRNRTIGVMLAAGGAGLFSLKGVVIKLAFAEGIGVSQLLTLRMAFSLPVYLTIGIIAFTRMKQKPAAKFFLMSGGLGLMSYYFSSWLNFEGLKYVSAQLERLILYIYPTMVALMSWMFLKDKITKQHVIALVLAYAGVAIMFGAEIGHQGPNALLGGGLIFAGAFIYAIYVTASKPVIARMGSTLFTAFGMSVASIAFLTQSGIEMLVTAPPPVTANGYWLALTLAIFCTVIPSFMIAEAIGRIGPGPMSAVGGVGPVVAAWAAVVILHEPFGWPHFAAMALTILGVWLLAKPRITRTAGARTW